MALATCCTGCGTIFRISTAQAAAKGGMVRCGACRHVFNALDALVRVEDLDVVEEVVIEPMRAAEAANDTLGGPALDDAKTDDGPAEIARPVVEAANDGDGGRNGEAVPREATSTASHDDASPPAVAGEWWMPDPAAPKPVEDAFVAMPTSSLPVVDDEEPDDEQGRETTPPAFLRDEPAVEPAPRALRVVLAALSFVAAVLLCAQLAYLWRDEIAARWPPSRSWLVAACDALGCRVDRPVHADRITIESASVETSTAGPNAYVLTALLRNRDVVDLRYPTLELVLTDLQDRPVLRRDLRPEDYLAGRSPAAGFPAQSELPVRLAFELSNLRFAGYRLIQFYP